jgi:RHS repeat-associated protein
LYTLIILLSRLLPVAAPSQKARLERHPQVTPMRPVNPTNLKPINKMGTTTVTYDAAGDMTADGTGVGTHTYQWDAEGRLVSVDGVAGQACQSTWTACFVYNAVGKRVEKRTGSTYTEYLYGAHGELIGTHNRTGWTGGFAFLGARPVVIYADGVTYFVHPNHLGSTAMVTNHFGDTVQKTLDYPWGQLWASAGTIHDERFASLEQRDAETDLDPTPFRLYHSRLYRWLSPDPLEGNILNPQSLNRYAYVLNNPTNLTDPLGLSGCTMVWQEVPGGEPIPGLDCTDDTAPADLPPHPILTPADTGSGWYSCMSASPYCPNGLYATTSPPVIGPAPKPNGPKIGPVPDPKQKRAPTKKYSDFLSCTGAAAAGAISGNESGPWLILVHAALLAPRIPTGPAIAAALVFDFTLAVNIRETCIDETYGPGYF